MRHLLVVSMTVALAGCGGGSDAPTFDAPPRIDAAPRVDAIPGCADPTVILPADWQSKDLVSTGAVASMGSGGMVLVDVDATAGGPAAFGTFPYTYVKFDPTGLSASRVDITDVESYQSSAWDLAFKRTVIRSNSGDSGPAGVLVSSVSGSSLASVTTVPDSSTFSPDDWASQDCMLIAGQLGEPLTAMGGWYMYDTTTHMVSPLATIYVLQLAGGQYIKLRITNYYGDAANPMRGANYDLEWAPLP